MSRARARRIAWGLWGLSLALAASDVLLVMLTRSIHTADDEPFVVGAGLTLALLSFATAGALIVARQPGNAVGWIFCAFGVGELLGGPAEGYARYTLLAHPGALPGGAEMAWLAATLHGLAIYGPLLFLLLYFPDGRLSSPRWRLAVRLNWIALALIFAGAFKSGPIDGALGGEVDNPFGIARADALLNLLLAGGLICLFVAAIASAVGIVRRLRRARGVERQQLKWFALAGAALAGAIVVAPYFWAGLPGYQAWPVIFLLAICGIPVAAGIAILKHNLYDIDLIINRALVYAALTATLALTYVVLVVAFGGLLRGLTGERSDLVTAASTLAVAALFRPLRGGIQRVVDRRFYRHKYDAATTLDAFATRLRDELDLDALRVELIEVVQETMQPMHVSLWLREAPPAAGSA